VAQMLRSQLAVLPGIRAFPQVPPSIRIGGRQSSSVYQYTLYGSDLDELYRVAPEFQEKIRALPSVIDVTSDLLVTSPQLFVDIDRDRASSLGVSAQQIEDVLYSAFGSRQVSTIYTSTNQYFVILKLADEFQRDPHSLSLLYLRNNVGKLIALDAVTRTRTTVGPLTVTHLGQLPSVTLSFNLESGASLSHATEAIEKLALTELPATVNGSFQGTAAAFTKSLNGLGALLLCAVLGAVVGFTAWRVAPHRRTEAPVTRPSKLVTIAQGAGFSPAGVAGLRLAVEPGRGACTSVLPPVGL